MLTSLAIVIAGAAVRLVASWGDFWLDEIWSWRFAASAKSYWQIATQFAHDNNQILNTWIMYTLPLDVHWTVYRIPAVLAGIGTVILAGLCGLRRSRCECLTALLLTSSSFVLIQYSSEARGYAYLLFFTLLCIWLMERVTVAPQTCDEWIFGISASLGFLGHFLFAGAYIGLAAWSAITALTSRRRWSARLLSLVNLHSLPCLTIGGLAFFFGGGLMTGGGERQRLSDVLIEAGSLAVGGPQSGRLAELCCCAAILVSVAGLILLFRRGEGLFYFVAASTIGLVLMIIYAKPEAIYMRHFLIPVVCLLMTSCHLLARLWQAGISGRLIYLAAVGLFLGGNSVHTWHLLQSGRGGYQAALAYLLAESNSPNPTVGSDFDFRNTMVLDYYYRRLIRPKPLVYVPQGRWPAQGVDWIILHSFDQPPKPEPTIPDGNGNQYRLVRVFPYSGLSGWNWMLYQRIDP